MTTYAWPATSPFKAATMQWLHHRNDRESSSPLNGSTQGISLPGMRFGIVVSFPPQVAADRRQVEAFLMRLDGKRHRAQIKRPGYAGPAGTINRTGVTAAAASQFAESLVLSGCGASTTLLAGDWLAITTSTGVQLLQVPADAVANGSGVMTVEVKPMLRGSVGSGAAVELAAPAALYMLADANLSFPLEQGGICPGLTVEFIEAFS